MIEPVLIIIGMLVLIPLGAACAVVWTSDHYDQDTMQRKRKPPNHMSPQACSRCNPIECACWCHVKQAAS